MTVYASGSKKLPPPQHVVFADLVLPRLTGTRAWVVLAGDEVGPRLLERREPTTVTWSSLWPGRPHDVLRFDLATVGVGDTVVTFTATAPDDDPPDEATAERVRFRVSHLIGADLRLSYDA